MLTPVHASAERGRSARAQSNLAYLRKPSHGTVDGVQSMECVVNWQAQSGMSFVAETGSGHMVCMDGAAEGGGRNLAPRPMEMVLTGTAGCTAYDVVLILKRGRQDVRGCQVKVPTGPTPTRKFSLRFTCISSSRAFACKNRRLLERSRCHTRSIAPQASCWPRPPASRLHSRYLSPTAFRAPTRRLEKTPSSDQLVQARRSQILQASKVKMKTPRTGRGV